MQPNQRWTNGIRALPMLLALGVAGCTCGHPAGTDAGIDAGIGGDSAMASDSGPAGTDAGGTASVPPPSPTYLDLFDTEPNDTPETADDGGTLEDFGGGFYYWGTNFAGMPCTLGGADEVDYYSFALPGTVATTITFPVNPCWGTGPDLVDATVYSVGAGGVLTSVWSSATPDPSCEGTPSVMLPGGTAYLLELRVPDPPSVPAAVEYFW